MRWPFVLAIVAACSDPSSSVPSADAGGADASLDAAEKRCSGVPADLDDPATGCAEASCTACPLPPGAEATRCTSGACDYTCMPGLTATATGCGPAASAIRSTTWENATCAITAHRNVKCWGQIGVVDGGLDTPTPQLVPGLADVSALAAGDAHFCALTLSGDVWCWGENFVGELGNGGAEDSAMPVHVDLPMSAKAITASSVHSCAALENGDVWCWGGNPHGVLGRSTTSDTGNLPAAIAYANAHVVQLAASFWQTCGLQQEGTILCWGANPSGELGTGTLADISAPAQVVGITAATAVEVGSVGSNVGTGKSGGYAFAIRSGGTVYAWGHNHYLLGLGSQANTVTVPTKIGSLSGIAEIVAGGEHVCARSTAGALTCWGDAGYGALGQVGLDDPYNYLHTPTAITEFGTGVRHVASGPTFTCLVLDDTLRCAGANAEGQLGTGATGDPSVAPLTVANWSFSE